MAVSVKVSSIQIQGITVEIHRKSNKHVYMRLLADGRVLVTAPFRTSDAQITQIVSAHISRIREHQARLQIQKNALVSSESIGKVCLWGKWHTLIFNEQEGAKRMPRYRLLPDSVIITLPKGSPLLARRQAIEQLLLKELQTYMQRMLPSWAERMEIRNLQWFNARMMKTRWGSCTPKTGRIRLNGFLAQFPECCAEMVIVHELVHFFEPSHNARFYTLMNQFLPTWRASSFLLKNQTPRIMVESESTF